MTQMYFNADLKSLVEGLTKYMPEEDVYEFIENMDNIERGFYEKGGSVLNNIYELKECSKFLLDCYLSFLIDSYENGLINFNDIPNFISDFFKFVWFSVGDDKKNDASLSSDEIEGLLEKHLSGFNVKFHFGK